MRQMITARRQGYWDLRAAANFIGGGMGTGLVLASVMATLVGAESTIPLLIGLASIALGLSMVWLEIGKPWRALNVFFHPQTSWMTREGIIAGPMLAIGGVAAWMHYTALLVIAALLGIGFLYCQARILKASRAIPAWSNRHIPPLVMAMGLVEGFGAFLAIAGSPSVIVVCAIFAVFFCEVAYALYRRDLRATKAPSATVACFSGTASMVVIGCRLAALILLVIGFTGNVHAVQIGGMLMVCSGWTFKVLLVTKAAYTRGAAIPFTPTRGRSVAREVG